MNKQCYWEAMQLIISAFENDDPFMKYLLSIFDPVTAKINYDELKSVGVNTIKEYEDGVQEINNKLLFVKTLPSEEIEFDPSKMKIFKVQ